MNQKKKILLGVTGGIAAYRSCSLVNYLIKEGYEVRVMMTKSATKFVQPLTFQSLTSHEVYVDLFKTVDSEVMDHIWISKWADLVVLAPLTACTLGKLAHGIIDNFLTTVIYALPDSTKVIISPAMNTQMLNNPVVKSNLESLLSDKSKYLVAESRKGILACRDEGMGKMCHVEDIVSIVKKNI